MPRRLFKRRDDVPDDYQYYGDREAIAAVLRADFDLDTSPSGSDSETDIVNETVCAPHYDHQSRTAFRDAGLLLKNAIHALLVYCSTSVQVFELEVQDIRPWADPLALRALWADKMNWNGIPAKEVAGNEIATRDERCLSYSELAEDVNRAWRQFGKCWIPRVIFQVNESTLTRLEAIMATRNLNAIFDSIRDLLRLVREHRSEVKNLCARLEAARLALDGIANLWTSRQYDHDTRLGQLQISENNRDTGGYVSHGSGPGAGCLQERLEEY